MFATGKAQDGAGGCRVISKPVKDRTTGQNQNTGQTLEGRTFRTTGQNAGQIANMGLFLRVTQPYGSLHRRPGGLVWGERLVD